LDSPLLLALFPGRENSLCFDFSAFDFSGTAAGSGGTGGKGCGDIDFSRGELCPDRGNTTFAAAAAADV
jgi:hypothetical protein